jgi:hypothetical protein
MPPKMNHKAPGMVLLEFLFTVDIYQKQIFCPFHLYTKPKIHAILNHKMNHKAPGMVLLEFLLPFGEPFLAPLCDL